MRWARKRAGLTVEVLAMRWRKYPQWESGEASPTPRQLEALAQRTHTPLGFFFIPWAPSDELEIADFRTPEGKRPVTPSMGLLETVHLCRLRQQWYHEQALLKRSKPLKFVGCMQPTDAVVNVAESIRTTVKLQPQGCADAEDAELALETMIGHVEAAGIMVMRGGGAAVVAAPGIEDPEFRGMALSDAHAPLIYLDARDAAAAQIFTLAHELAHLWLGISGISNPHDTLVADGRVIEAFCNRVAAEALVPLSAFRDAWDMNETLERECARLAEVFCVSTPIILRRAYDAGFLEGDTFHAVYQKAAESVNRAEIIRGVSGKPLTPLQRVGRRFGEAVAAEVQAHKVDEHEAMALLSACTPEEVWTVGGSHDEWVDADLGDEVPAYAHLVGR
ncbi:MAG: XRE family transcriptional regulator [Prosthecobacter sp.]|nr:XRE family transcriptional regulator [Prosthecobacter sp.]